MEAPTVIVIVVLALLVLFLALLLVHALRQTPDLTDPTEPTPANMLPGDTIDELIRTVRAQQDRQHELAMKLAAALEKMAAPYAPVDYTSPEFQPDLPYTIDDIPWDPTDADPTLGDDTYRDVALTRTPVFDNSAPDIITHPLGIPGLSLPYPPRVTDEGWEGLPDRDGRAFDVVA